MNGGEGDHRLELGQEPGQEIGFVFMSVNDVDLSFADQAAAIISPGQPRLFRWLTSFWRSTSRLTQLNAAARRIVTMTAGA